MKALGQKVTSVQLKEIIREVDRNGNGMIDFNEVRLTFSMAS